MATGDVGGVERDMSRCEGYTPGAVAQGNPVVLSHEMACARRGRVRLALASALLPLAMTAAAGAQPRKPQPPLAQSLPADARRDYDAGKLLFEDGDYATALLKYRDAYDRTHDARLLWNVAACQKNLRHYAKAAATLARYLAEGGDLLSSGDRHDALELTKAIAPFTVPMTFNVDEKGAQVWVDDELVGTSPLPGPVTLDMGARRVRVKKDGFRLYERDVPVGGSAPTTVDIALEKQSGRLELTVPASATVFLDEKEVGRGPHVALDLPAGAHALRVVAPHMRPLQTDVVVEDGKSRALDLPLEAETAPSAEVHVAVACITPDALQQQGLAVYFDDATESAMPLGVRLRREPGREVVAYVPYRIVPGRHTVHVASERCEGRDVVVDVPDGGVALVKGELSPRNAWLEGSPAGSPDGWRVTAGLVVNPIEFAFYQKFFSNTAPAFGNAFLTQFGPSAAVGLQGRWLTALLEARFVVGRLGAGTGSSSVTAGTPNGPPPGYGSTLSQWSIGIRPGVRLPLVIAALSSGVGAYLGAYSFSPDSGTAQSGGYSSFSYWGAIDAQPFCEWGLQLGAATSADTYNSSTSSVGNQAVTSLWLHATYTPNSMCDRKRAGRFTIEATTH
jgi:hypothetical protein